MAFPQSARFAIYLRRMFSIREPMADMNVLQDFMPIMHLDAPVMPEMQRLRDEKLWGMFIQVAASVGNISSVLFRAPPGKVSVITAWHLFSSTNVSIAMTNVAFAGAQIQCGSSDGRDNRIQGVGTAFETRLNIAAPATGIFKAWANQGQFSIPLVMWGDAPAGDPLNRSAGVIFANDVVNQALNVTVAGYERSVEPSEISF